MKAVVTGGAGFVGSHLVDLLVEQGLDVVVIDNLATGRRENLAHHAPGKVQLDEQDVAALEPGSPSFRGASWVFHLAGIGDIVPSIEAPTEYMRVNTQGTVRVLEAARAAGVERFLYAGSSSCYGPNPPVPTKESAPVVPAYPYALSKWMGEEAALHWAKVYQLPVTSLRMFNVYGPRSRTTGAYGAVFGVFLAQRLHQKPLTIVGDGTQTRDFIHAKDIARAYLAAAASPSAVNQVFNVGAGNPQSVLRLAELIGGPLEHLPKRPGEPDCTWADISKIGAALQWKPTVSFEEGVADVLGHMDAWRDAPVWTRESIEHATRGWFKHLGTGT